MANSHNTTKKCRRDALKSAMPALLRDLCKALEAATDLPTGSLLNDARKPRLLTPKQASAMLGLSVKTLANLRSTGMADLPYRKISTRIFYRRVDVLRFRKRRKFHSTSEYTRPETAVRNA